MGIYDDPVRNELRGNVKMYRRQGYSVKEIAYFTDRSEAEIRQLLSERTRKEIRMQRAVAFRAQGLNDTEISAKMGIPNGQVRNLLNEFDASR